MKNLKKLQYLAVAVLFSMSLISCGDDTITASDNGDLIEDGISNGNIVLDKYSINFGKIQVTKGKPSFDNQKTEIITLTNNSDETITGLDIAVDFEGNLDANVEFAPVPKGETIDIPFTFSPSSDEVSGEYKGKAIITPSIGDPIEIELIVIII